MSELITDYLRANRQFHRARKRRQHLLYVIYSHPNTYQKLMNLLKSRHDRASRNIKAGQAKSKKKIGRPSKWYLNPTMQLAFNEAAIVGARNMTRRTLQGLSVSVKKSMYRYANISKIARKYHVSAPALRYLIRKENKESGKD